MITGDGDGRPCTISGGSVWGGGARRIKDLALFPGVVGGGGGATHARFGELTS